MDFRSRLIAVAFAATCLTGAAAAAPAPAVDPEVMRQVEAARGAIYARKGAALDAVMHLDAAQQAKFGPVLKAYDDELLKLGDRRIELIKEFIGHYQAQSLTDKDATRLVRESIEVRKDQLALLDEYFGKASKAIGVRKASEWIQVENAFMSAVDTKVALLMPVLSDAMKE